MRSVNPIASDVWAREMSEPEPAIFQLAESTGAKADSGYAQAKPYIDALDYLISGSGSQDGNAEVKAVLGVR